MMVKRSRFGPGRSLAIPRERWESRRASHGQQSRQYLWGSVVPSLSRDANCSFGRADAATQKGSRRQEMALRGPTGRAEWNAEERSPRLTPACVFHHSHHYQHHHQHQHLIVTVIIVVGISLSTNADAIATSTLAESARCPLSPTHGLSASGGGT
jgi:hypothetical protein